MSNVPKSKRKKGDFYTNSLMISLRKRITEISSNMFGYDSDKYEERIKRLQERYPNKDSVQKYVDKERWKNYNFYEEFCIEERKYLLQIYREIISNFEEGNNIFPTGSTKFMEYCIRREHMTNVVTKLNVLKQELQYISETLPVDKNKYTYIIKDINTLIKCVKGIRQADNKFLKQNK